MAVRVGNLILANWQALHLSGGWSDTFIFPVSYRSGLPPGDYAQLLRRMVRPLLQLRRSVSLWVQTDAPGFWFTEELRQRLRGLPLPVAVTDGRVPTLRDFSFSPWTDRSPSPPPPQASPLLAADLSPHVRACLRVLARLQQGSTTEISALTGLSEPTVREALQTLMVQKRIAYMPESNAAWKYPVWRILRPGVSLALRSWGVPLGITFDGYKERAVTQPHARHVARRWPARVKQAWPEAEIWAGWSEVNLGNPFPDALAWGRLSGRECLFWLEVERGNQVWAKTQENFQNKVITRFNRALVYTRRFSSANMRLVFVVLGPERLQQARAGFGTVPGDAAIVLADWRAEGALPEPLWGQVC